MAWWQRKKAKPEETRDFFSDLSGASDPSIISKEQAMAIPALNAGVNLIASTIASLPIKLYKKEGQKITSMDDDSRVAMLNTSTGDLLDGYQMKKAVIEDSIIYGAGYIFINKQRNNVQSLNYVHNPSVGVSILDPDPIFKKYEFLVYGQTYKDYQFIKLTRKTKNGVTGLGVLNEVNKLLSVSYNTMVFEDTLVRGGGQRKGFLKSAGRLSLDAINQLKQAFKNLYSNNNESIVVLNSGLEFQESNANFVELQLNQNKETNSAEIAKLLNIPVELLDGKVTQFELLYNGFVKLAVMPVIKAFESALNKDLLLEKEKGSYFFEFDVSDLEKFAGNILQRFQAYQIGLQEGFYKLDEVREKENLPAIGFDYIKLNLANILYDPQTDQIYTPNTNKLVKMGEQTVDDNPPQSPVAGENPSTGNNEPPSQEGGEKQDESGNQK